MRARGLASPDDADAACRPGVFAEYGMQKLISSTKN
jgi:hypothetical protein